MKTNLFFCFKKFCEHIRTHLESSFISIEFAEVHVPHRSINRTHYPWPLGHCPVGRWGLPLKLATMSKAVETKV